MTISEIFSLVAAIVSVVGALVTISKAKPEKKKLEAEGYESIAGAAENIADGANVTVGVFKDALKQLEAKNKREREEFQREIKSLNDKIKNFDAKLSSERTARVRAERKIDALQSYIEQLKDLMTKANLTPPPFLYNEPE